MEPADGELKKIMIVIIAFLGTELCNFLKCKVSKIGVFKKISYVLKEVSLLGEIYKVN